MRPYSWARCLTPKALPIVQSATISALLYHFNHLSKRESEFTMGACTCGYSTDPEKNCNGTHKVVKAVKEDLAVKLEANGFPHAAEYVRNN